MADDTPTTPVLSAIPQGTLTIGDVSTQTAILALLPDGVTGAVSINANAQTVVLVAPQGIYFSPWKDLSKTTWTQVANQSDVVKQINQAIAGGKVDLSDYLTKEDTAKTYLAKADADKTYAKSADLGATYATKTDISAVTTQVVHTLADYLKTADLPTALGDSLSAYAKTADMTKGDADTLNAAKANAKSQIDALISGAPETMDTLKELADAIDSNKSVADAVNSAIGNKANSADVYNKTDVDNKVKGATDIANAATWTHTNDVMSHLPTTGTPALPEGIKPVGAYHSNDVITVFRPDDQLDATLYLQNGKWNINGVVNL